MTLCISIPQTSVPASHVLNVVNGNIVALCEIDVNSNEDGITHGPRVLNRLPLCPCYGFGEHINIVIGPFASTRWFVVNV